MNALQDLIHKMDNQASIYRIVTADPLVEKYIEATLSPTHPLSEEEFHKQIELQEHINELIEEVNERKTLPKQKCL